jgi:SAM-dependent methyltransferase
MKRGSAIQTPNGKPTDAGWFQRLQTQYFAHADAAKFHWQTSNPYLARTERDLIKLVPVAPSERLLEVGCGEGGNLKLMTGTVRRAVGVDYSLPKVQWAAKHVAGADFAGADATQLPFRDGSFDVVLCRDVLHHLMLHDKRKVVDELVRVCRLAGRVVVIEPNGRNPFIRLQGLMVEAERDALLNTWTRLEPFFSQQAAEPTVRWAQPFPLGRILFHYRWGLPRLSRFLGTSVLLVERLIGRRMPSECWAYIVVTMTKGQCSPVL